MRQPTLSGIVKRRFLHCVSHHHQPVRDLVTSIGISPGDMCRLIAGQKTQRLPLHTYHQIAVWLRIPLANVMALAGFRPALQDLLHLGMAIRGLRVNSTQDQVSVANDAKVSVAVFRRALHGYVDFRPSLRTCERLTDWLAWTGLELDDVVLAAGMIVHYQANGKRVLVSPEALVDIRPYPCACGRAGCMVPAHIPSGPRRKWRSDACRMWVTRKRQREAMAAHRDVPISPTPLHLRPIVRFIVINERRIPVRF
jgi:hypothetical protein